MMLGILHGVVRVIEFLEKRRALSADGLPSPGQDQVWAIRVLFDDGSMSDYVYRPQIALPNAVTAASFPYWPPPGTHPIPIFAAGRPSPALGTP